MMYGAHMSFYLRQTKALLTCGHFGNVIILWHDRTGMFICCYSAVQIKETPDVETNGSNPSSLAVLTARTNEKPGELS